MFWNKGKKSKEVAAVVEGEDEPTSNGFFSTSGNFRIPRQQMLQNAMAKSFQKTVKDFAIYDTDARGNTGVAMDAAPVTLAGLASRNITWGGVPDAQAAWYGSQGFIGYQMCAVIAQHWLVSKACSLPGKDAIRKGFEITVNDGVEVAPEVLDAIRVADKRMKLNKNLEEFSKFNRVFGVRVAMFDIDTTDPDYYAKPFNIDGVKKGSYRGISQIDPYWIMPELDLEAVSNPASRHFYDPTWWNINGKRVHRSHLVVIRGDEVADVLKPSYLYGGISLVQKIYERVYASERTANEAPMLAMTKRLNVRKIDMKAALANQKGFEERMALGQYLRDNYGTVFAGTEEGVEQLETSLTDLDAVIMSQYQLVSAIANIPATKLLGVQPKGFNSSGEYEEASYHEELESVQTNELTPLIERHHLLLIKSEIAPAFKIQPFGTSINWTALDSLTEKEQAEINKIKAETDTALSGAGAIDAADIRNRLISEQDSGYNGIPEALPEQPLDPAEEVTPADNILDEAEIVFDREKGRLGGAYLITTQEFRNPEIVQKKIVESDYNVQVSPEFQLENGKSMRVILDGHHSFDAALMAGVEPIFVEQTVDDDKKLHALAIDAKTFLRAADSGSGKYCNVITKDVLCRV